MSNQKPRLSQEDFEARKAQIDRVKAGDLAIAFANPSIVERAKQVIGEKADSLFGVLTPYPGNENGKRQIFVALREAGAAAVEAIMTIDRMLAEYKATEYRANRKWNIVSYGVSLPFPVSKFQTEPVKGEDGLVRRSFASADGFPFVGHREVIKGEDGKDLDVYVFGPPTASVINATLDPQTGKFTYEVEVMACYPERQTGEVRRMAVGLEWRAKVSSKTKKPVVHSIDNDDDLLYDTGVNQNFFRAMQKSLEEAAGVTREQRELKRTLASIDRNNKPAAKPLTVSIGDQIGDQAKAALEKAAK